MIQLDGAELAVEVAVGLIHVSVAAALRSFNVHYTPYKSTQWTHPLIDFSV